MFRAVSVVDLVDKRLASVGTGSRASGLWIVTDWVVSSARSESPKHGRFQGGRGTEDLMGSRAKEDDARLQIVMVSCMVHKSAMVAIAHIGPNHEVFSPAIVAGDIRLALRRVCGGSLRHRTTTVLTRGSRGHAG
jgi:hypothetical protein